MKFEKLIVKKQYRNPQTKPDIDVMGMDTETNTKINRVELICAENGEYLLPTSFEELMEYFFLPVFKGCTFVFYNLKFDAQAILKWMYIDEQAESNPWLELWEDGKTEYEDYTLELIPWKILTIKHNIKHDHKIVLYDVQQFFNTSLDKAARQYLKQKKLTIVDRANIEDFASPNAIKYCKHDAFLAGELGRYVLALSDQHFPDSPKTLVSKASISEKHFRETCQIPTINNVINNNMRYIKMAWLTYKGGLFSAYQKGYFESLYCYDINSAYPYHMTNLPNLNKGRMVEFKGFPPMGADMGWLACQVDLDPSQDECYISPLAVDVRNSRYYPSGKFTTWITLDEYEAIKNIFWTKPLVGVYWFASGEKEYPLRDEINRLYEWKKTEKDPGLKYFIKIVLNSLYGKTVQKIPDRKTDLYNTGNLFNPFWASYITAGTRLQLYKQLQQINYDDIILIATDSIMTKKPLPIPCDDNLGGWDLEKHGEAIVIGSGVYSIKTEDTTLTRNRGFKPVNNIDFFDLNFESKYSKIDMTVRHHVSLAQALVQKNYDAMNLISDRSKSLNLNFDNRRVWDDRFNKVDDILHKQISSVPHEINFLNV